MVTGYLCVKKLKVTWAMQQEAMQFINRLWRVNRYGHIISVTEHNGKTIYSQCLHDNVSFRSATMMCKHFKKEENGRKFKTVTKLWLQQYRSKVWGQKEFFLKKELMLLISKDTFNWSKVTVKTFMYFLLIKESWK